MTVTKRLRFEILRRDGHTCRYCGAKAPDAPLRVDHVIPEALGGTDDPSNLVTACEPCNSGKSSIAPDSPIVADVAADALRWARAMQLAADERATQRSAARELYDAFNSEWNRWTDWRGQPLSRPGGWESSIDQFFAAGLVLDDLVELITAAMQARAKDTWRYFCGCAWTRIRELQARARELVEFADGVGIEEMEASSSG